MKRARMILTVITLISILGIITANDVMGYSLFITNGSTAIEEIVWEEIDQGPYENEGSYFRFHVKYQIFNPEPITVRIEVSCVGDDYWAHVNASFDDSNLTMLIDYGPCLTMMDTLKIKPGVSSGWISFRMIISEEGFTVLPDGNYTLWIDVASQRDMDLTMSESVLKVKEGSIDISYGALQYPTPTLLLDFVFVICNSGLIVVLLITRKRSKSNQETLISNKT